MLSVESRQYLYRRSRMEVFSRKYLLRRSRVLCRCSRVGTYIEGVVYCAGVLEPHERHLGHAHNSVPVKPAPASATSSVSGATMHCYHRWF